MRPAWLGRGEAAGGVRELGDGRRELGGDEMAGWVVAPVAGLCGGGGGLGGARVRLGESE
jgi:hypothetical protein